MKYLLQILFLCLLSLFSFKSIAQELLPENIDTNQVPIQLDSMEKRPSEIPYGPHSLEKGNGGIFLLQSSDFQKGLITDPMQLAQGKIPGLILSRPGSDPNQLFNIRLRATTTLSGQLNPLIVVDGHPGIDPMAIAPEEIEQITVLKDAASANLYGGIRAGSGVLLITTKTGYQGPPKLRYSFEWATHHIIRNPTVMDGNRFRLEVNDRGYSYRDFGASTDWLEETRKGFPASGIHSLQLTGGSKQTQYRFGLHFSKVNGTIQQSDYRQISPRLSLTQYAFQKRLQIRLNSSYFDRKQHDFNYTFGNTLLAPPNNLISHILLMNPTAPVREDNVFFQEVQAGLPIDNPVARLDQTLNESQKTLFTNNLSARFELFEGMQVEGRLGSQQNNWIKGLDAVEEAVIIRSLPFNSPYHMLLEERTEDYLGEINFSFTRSVGKHYLHLLAGHSYQYRRFSQLLRATVNPVTINFDFYDLRNDDLVKDVLIQDDEEDRSRKISSFFGRLAYSYDDWLFFEASTRRDGASNLGTANKWGVFPSFGIGLDLKDLLAVNAIDQLKIRTSYGETGNLPRFDYGSQALLDSTFYFTYYEGSFQRSFDVFQVGNPFLKWETSKEWNYGLDLRLWENKVAFHLDIFRKRTTDIIQQTIVEPVVDFIQRLNYNGGEMSSRGYEVSLEWQIINRPNRNWHMGLLFYKNESRFESLSSPEISFIGPQYIGALDRQLFFNFISLPVYVNEGSTFGDLWGPYFITAANGREEFQDLNGDGFFCNCAQDIGFIANALPSFNWGMQQHIRWGAWSLDFSLRAVRGHHLVNLNQLILNTPDNVRETNVSPDIQTGPYSVLDFQGSISDLWIEEASFIRIDYARLLWSAPLQASRRIKDLDFSLTIQNLATFTNYTGMDPEVRLEQPLERNAPGIDERETYFLQRSFVFGVSVGI